MADILNLFDEEDEINSPEYDAALAAWRKGWNVIPLLHMTKRPPVKYAHWHMRRQLRSEVGMMRPLFDGGLALVTGAVSGIVCLDCDGPEGEQVLSEFGDIPETLTVLSGSERGLHRYFQHPLDGQKVVTRANPSIKLDVKGDGGIAVLPPTLHKSGRRYTIVSETPLATLPVGLIKFVEKKAAEASGRLPEADHFSRAKKLISDNVSRRPPLNRRNALIVKSMLAALPDQFADDYDTWLRVGFALYAFDAGRVGFALWTWFSMRCPAKAATTDLGKQWASFGRRYEGKKITIGTLWAMAVEHGWTPIPWDWREDQ